MREGVETMRKLRTRDKVRMVLQGIAILVIDVVVLSVFYFMYIGLWLIMG